MNPKQRRFLLFCALLLIVPSLSAQPAFPTPPVTIPQRRVTPGRRATNTTAANPAFPAPGAAPTGATPGATAPGVPAFPVTTAPPGPGAPAATAAIPATTGLTPSGGADPAIYDYDIPSMPIDELLDNIYAPLVGKTLLRSGTGPAAIPGTATITLKTQKPLTKSEAIIALETVLGMNGVSIVPLGDKFAKVVAEAAVGSAGGVISTNLTSTNLPLAGKFITEIVQLKYADGQDLSDLLKQFAKGQTSIIYVKSTQTLILRDYAENMARMLELVEKIDVASPLQIKPEVIPIRYALASDMAAALSALGASGGTSVGKNTSGANFRSGGSGGGSGGFGTGAIGNTGSQGGFGGYGGGGGGGGYPGQGIGVQSESIRPMDASVQTFGDGTFSPMAANPVASSARSSFQQNLQRIVAGAQGQGQFTLFGQTKIIADERTNSLLVFANDDDMKMIKEIIKKLDVVLPQVLIEAIVMEINLTGTRNTGVSYLSQKQNIGQFSGAGGLNNLSSGASSFLTGGTNGGSSIASATGPATLASLPGGFSYFANYGNDLSVVLEAVAGDSRVNVLSCPRIQTSHAVPADIFIGNTVPYVTGTYNYGYGSGPSAQYTQLEVGIRMQVLPLINPEGLVEMDIQQDIEQLGPNVAIQGVGNVPTTTKRQAGAKVAVQDGQTILLGGFISDSRSKATAGIPWLKDLPVFGVLFRSTADQNLRTELVIMMRPTVLPTPSIAAQVAAQERNKLSAVKQAELEIREDERKRNAAIEIQLQKDEEQRQKERLKHPERFQPEYTPGITNVEQIPPIEDQ